MHTILTFVFRDYGEDAWHTESALLFDEDHVTQEMVTLAISTPPGRKERRLHFELSHPLTPLQQRELTWLQETGMFSTYFVSDEAEEETQPPHGGSHFNTSEGRAKLVNDVQKLGEIAGKLIAAHTYPAIIREKDVLETTAHLLWAVLRGEEPAAETFGVSYATSYLEQVSTLNKMIEGV